MTSIASVSPTDLKARRQQLKRRRQLKFLQGLWRSLLVGSMSGGLVWAVAQPNWVIHKPEQVQVEGNRLISSRTIRALLPLSYPQALWKIQPQILSQGIESAAPIANASVTRKLLPPSLTVEVTERQPVAQVLHPQSSTERDRKAIGFLDEAGVWMPQSSYAHLGTQAKLPSLRVVGIDKKYLPYWSEIYQATRHSALEIFEIDFQNPANLMLKTELGNVHLGQYKPHSPRLTQQLEVLAQMRQLPTQVKTSQIDYIDLTNPEFPTIQLHQLSMTPVPLTKTAPI